MSEIVVTLNSEVLTQMLYAIVIAVIYSLASYFKVHGKEEFNMPMFIKTILVGAIVGAIQYYAGYTYEQAFTFVMSNSILLLFIDDLINKIFIVTPKSKGAVQ
jgi:hypothetical protein